MPTAQEDIAVKALREIMTYCENTNPGVRIARKALDQIDALNKPTVHNLSADDVVIDKPPGGGL
jgi:hypothetical protein